MSYTLKVVLGGLCVYVPDGSWLNPSDVSVVDVLFPNVRRPRVFEYPPAASSKGRTQRDEGQPSAKRPLDSIVAVSEHFPVLRFDEANRLATDGEFRPNVTWQLPREDDGRSQGLVVLESFQVSFVNEAMPEGNGLAINTAGDHSAKKPGSTKPPEDALWLLRMSQLSGKESLVPKSLLGDGPDVGRRVSARVKLSCGSLSAGRLTLDDQGEHVTWKWPDPGDPAGLPREQVMATSMIWTVEELTGDLRVDLRAFRGGKGGYLTFKEPAGPDSELVLHLENRELFRTLNTHVPEPRNGKDSPPVHDTDMLPYFDLLLDSQDAARRVPYYKPSGKLAPRHGSCKPCAVDGCA